jgi:hypothetical protein
MLLHEPHKIVGVLTMLHTLIEVADLMENAAPKKCGAEAGARRKLTIHPCKMPSYDGVGFYAEADAAECAIEGNVRQKHIEQCCMPVLGPKIIVIKKSNELTRRLTKADVTGRRNAFTRANQKTNPAIAYAFEELWGTIG